MAQAGARKSTSSRSRSTRSAKSKKTSSKDLTQGLKKRLENLSVTVMKAERNAEKQVQKILKFTDKYKKDQLNKVRQMILEARKIKSTDLVRRAEKIRDEIEKRANSGMKTLLRSLDIPSKKEIEQLKSRIAQLESELQNRGNSQSVES